MTDIFLAIRWSPQQQDATNEKFMNICSAGFNSLYADTRAQRHDKVKTDIPLLRIVD
jgi:hypothetical protein